MNLTELICLKTLQMHVFIHEKVYPRYFTLFVPNENHEIKLWWNYENFCKIVEILEERFTVSHFWNF